MRRRWFVVLGSAVLALACVPHAAAAQRLQDGAPAIEWVAAEATRGSAPVPAVPPLLYEERATYWKQGALMGALVAGVVGVIMSEPEQSCGATTCSYNDTPVLASALLWAAGGAILGGIIGNAVER